MEPYEQNIGELDKRIDLLAPTRVADGMGGFVETRVVVASGVWAKAWTVSSSEGVEGGQMTMTRVQKFKIRYRSVLKGSWIVRYGGNYFSLKAIDPDERNVFIFLTCEEVAA